MKKYFCLTEKYSVICVYLGVDRTLCLPKIVVGVIYLYSIKTTYAVKTLAETKIINKKQNV